MASDLIFDVAGIGNAIVDILSFTDDTFLAQQRMNKGSMMLVDETRAAEVYRQLGQTTECSGGSVANTLAGIASLGAKTAFIGKVKNDQLGSIFIHDLHAVGVHFSTPPIENGPATASCMVCVTPDAQRTMATYIGACSMVGESDIDEDIIRHSSIVYIEGYLWDTQAAKAAIRKAIDIARDAKRKVAFTLSDTFCVDRHRNEFLQLIGSIDIVFANEAELKSLYQVTDVEAGLKKLQGACPIAAVTRSEKGSVVVTPDGFEEIPTRPVAKVVDTTGQGTFMPPGFFLG